MLSAPLKCRDTPPPLVRPADKYIPGSSHDNLGARVFGGGRKEKTAAFFPRLIVHNQTCGEARTMLPLWGCTGSLWEEKPLPLGGPSLTFRFGAGCPGPLAGQRSSCDFGGQGERWVLRREASHDVGPGWGHLRGVRRPRVHACVMSNPWAAVPGRKRKGPGLSFLASHRAGSRSSLPAQGCSLRLFCRSRWERSSPAVAGT